MPVHAERTSRKDRLSGRSRRGYFWFVEIWTVGNGRQHVDGLSGEHRMGDRVLLGRASSFLHRSVLQRIWLIINQIVDDCPLRLKPCITFAGQTSPCWRRRSRLALPSLLKSEDVRSASFNQDMSYLYWQTGPASVVKVPLSENSPPAPIDGAP